MSVVTRGWMLVCIAYRSAGRPKASHPIGMQHVKALHPPVAAEDVGRGVSLRVADMESGPGRIGKHVQDIDASALVAWSSVRKVL